MPGAPASNSGGSVFSHIESCSSQTETSHGKQNTRTSFGGPCDCRRRRADRAPDRCRKAGQGRHRRGDRTRVGSRRHEACGDSKSAHHHRRRQHHAGPRQRRMDRGGKGPFPRRRRASRSTGSQGQSVEDQPSALDQFEKPRFGAVVGPRPRSSGRRRLGDPDHLHRRGPEGERAVVARQGQGNRQRPPGHVRQQHRGSRSVCAQRRFRNRIPRRRDIFRRRDRRFRVARRRLFLGQPGQVGGARFRKSGGGLDLGEGKTSPEIFRCRMPRRARNSTAPRSAR